MCLVLASFEAFTLYVLSKFAERYQANTYGKLIRRALGRKLASGDRLCLDTSFYSMCCSVASSTSCSGLLCMLKATTATISVLVVT